MAKITAGVSTSHIPAVGAAIDLGKMEEDYWKPVFRGYEFSKEWMKENTPDVILLVYNDHASAFDLKTIPTFAIGCADEFQPADEGWGPRKVPVVEGHPELAWHLVENLILDEFDMAVTADFDVDHGLTVPLSIAYDQPDAWPAKVIPLCVNVIQYPQPTALRCFKLGQAIRRAVDSFPEDVTVGIWGTGGLSHQLGGERAGVVNPDFDKRFLDNLVSDPMANASLTHTDFIREAGSEGIEMIMWNVMRGALDEDVHEVYRLYHIPVSATAYGAIILENS
mgnify:CR=1 FL=1